MYEELIREVADYHGDLVRNIQTHPRLAGPVRRPLGRAPPPAPWRSPPKRRTACKLSEAPLITRPFDYGTVITYPFANFNGHATRFSDGLRYGVWYGSLDLETTVYETVYHRHRFLQDSFAGEDRPVRSERRVFEVRCDAILLDLRGKERDEPRLLDRRELRLHPAARLLPPGAGQQRPAGEIGALRRPQRRRCWPRRRCRACATSATSPTS